MTATRPIAAVLALTIAACAAETPEPRPALGVATPAPLPPVVELPADRTVRATIVPGRSVPAAPTPGRIAAIPPAGDVSLNFPGVPAGEVARAVLGDILRVQFSVDPGVQASINLVTQRPVARSAVLGLFEEALRPAGLALVPQAGGYRVALVDQARGSAPTVGAEQALGFGREVLRLQFVSSAELRKLIDPILPGVVQSADAASNSLVVAGTSGQRTSVRDLVRQFDVNWLRGVSFGLFVPQRTDARLIVPELEKVLNGPDSPTKGLVRLIAMDRLNGILAVSGQPQYLEDVRRWVEILDREGESAEPKLFVYRVQNGRATDLAAVLTTAFNGGGAVQSQGNAADAIGSGRQFGETGSDRQSRFSPQGGQAGQAGQGGFGGQGTTNFSGNTPGQAGAFGGGTAGAGVGNQNLANAQSRLANPAAGQQGLQGAGGTVLGATITSDDNNNAILVFGTPRAYATIEDALRQLDIAPAQVLIEASISEVTLTDELRYGLQSIFNTGTGDVTLSEVGAGGAGPAFGLPQVLRTFPGFSFLYTSQDITTVLNALEGLTKINVLSSPKLMVINNQTASLQVGNQVPIVSASNSSGLTGTTNEIEYRDTGVILKITPRVNAGGLVLLDIAQEVSDVVQVQSSTDAQTTSPTFSTRRIATSIAAQDGQTIALGGLISDSRSRGRTGIPFLSRIPIIGGILFGRTNDSTRRTELLILLRPRVVRNQDEGRALTQELISKIKTVRGLLDERRK